MATAYTLDDTRFEVPFRALVVGPSSSGKTVMMSKFLARVDKVCTRVPTRIIYYFSEHQDIYHKMRAECPVRLDFVRGFPQREELLAVADAEMERGGNTLVCLDDQMSASKKDLSFLVEIFTILGHHRLISILVCWQQFFHREPLYREISNNANYIILQAFPRNKSCIRNLASQMYPNKTSFFMDAYDQIMSTPYASMLIDCRGHCKPSARIRSCFLDDVSCVWNPIN